MAEKRILVVEDEAIIAMEIEDRLKELGYSVLELVDTGEEAVKKANSLHPDLVLMDIMLKENMTGIEAASKIRDEVGVPVIYLTANADKVTVQLAKHTEPFGYIVKPFKERDLQIAIELALYKHEIERKLRENRQWLETTLSSIGEAVLATDPEGNITFVNPVMESMLGRDNPDLLDKPIKEVCDLSIDEDGEKEVFPVDQALSTRNIVFENDAFLNPTGNISIPVDITAAPIIDEDDQIMGVVLVFRDITDRKMTQEWLQYLATHDTLTDLPNRYLFDDRLEQAIAAAKRTEHKLGIMYLDMNGFKIVNDTFGHAVGDRLLKAVGDRLKKIVRDSDTIARIGGDEFACLVTNIKDNNNILKMAEKIVHAFKTPFAFEGLEIQTGISVGICIYPDYDLEPSDLLICADRAMYIAKDQGQSGYYIYDSEIED